MSQTTVATQLMSMGARKSAGAQLARKLEKLQDSCKDFESVFTAKLLNVMRKTVPKNGLIHGGKGEEVFSGLLDDEIAENIADGQGLGLAQMIFDQLKQQLFGGEIRDPKFLELGKELLREAGGTESDNQELVEMFTAQEISSEDPAAVLPETAADNLVSGVQQGQEGTTGLKQMVPKMDPQAVAPDMVKAEGPVNPQIMTGEPALNQPLPEVQPQATGEIPEVKTQVNPADQPKAPEKNTGLQDIISSLNDKLASVQDERAPAAVMPETDAQGIKEADRNDPALTLVKQDVMDKYQATNTSEHRVNFARRILRSMIDGQQTETSGPEAGETQDIEMLKNNELFNTNSNGMDQGNNRSTAEELFIRQEEAHSKDEPQQKPVFNLMDTEASLKMKQLEILERANFNETLREIEEPAKVIDQIVRKADLLLKNGQNEMRIELEPKQLGEVRIKVVMENDILTAKIHAKSDQVGEIIRTNLTQLGDSLRDMGFDLGDFDVSTGEEYGDPGRSDQADDNGQKHSFNETMQESLETMIDPEHYQTSEPSGMYSLDVRA